MKLLLDTHALAWWLMDDSRLTETARNAIADPGNDVAVSAVSAFEVATKYRIGKWPAMADLVTGFPHLVAEQEFSLLPITVSHALLAGRFAAAHRDPFDRLLAAQAKLDSLVLVTADSAFSQFDIDLLW
jgi:PIN domain nuclease of toxin-antitoxin system